MLPVRVKVATVDKQVYHGSMEVQPAHNAIRYVEVDGHSIQLLYQMVVQFLVELTSQRIGGLVF